MTPTTKRGFHLPWSGDGRRPAESADAPAPRPNTSEPARGAGAPARPGPRARDDDDLGRGPFGLAPDNMPTEDDHASATARPTDQLVDNQSIRKPMPDRGAPKEASTAVSNPQMVWPDVDRAGSATHRASDGALPPVRPPVVVDGVGGSGTALPRASRRDNPLVVGLVRAMRDAARATREETTARMRADATARIDEIRSGSAAEAIALRKRADDDAVGIREWSKAEIARIRDEAEKRIAGRRAQLARATDAHAADVERLIEQVQGVATTFEAEMDQFFEILLAEQDPARLATLAEQVPDAPVFDALPALKRAQAPTRSNGTGKTRGPAGRSPATKTAATEPGDASTAISAEADAETVDDYALQARLEPDDAAAAEAEAIAGLDHEQTADGDWTAGSLTTVLATAPKIDSLEDLSPEELVGLLGIDTGSADDAAESDAAAGPEAATGPAGDEQTRVVVSGLTSVAGISAFKGSLGRVPGVASVSVSTGADDDFVFAVAHAPSTDLRRSVPEFPGFSAQMTVDDGELITFVVSEPR
jgi:hypothetical protein